MILMPTGEEIDQAKDAAAAAIKARPKGVTLYGIARAAKLPDHGIAALFAERNTVSVWRLRQIQDALIAMGLAQTD